ncbi:MAG: hypothetical protein ACREVP_05885 [Burkholderiales bacterium]
MFKILGSLLLCYVAHCLYTGRTFARRGAWGREYARDEAPFHYWSSVAVYALLAVALMTVF